MKKMIGFVTLASMMTAMSITSMATGWRGDDQTGWWYSTNDADTEWYHDGWHWIDGNGDGIAECYFFGPDGYIARNTSVDGYSVDKNGVWRVDGIIQEKFVGTDTASATSAMSIDSTVIEDVHMTLGQLKAKYGDYHTQNISVDERTSVCFEKSPLTYNVEEYYQSIGWNIIAPDKLSHNYDFYVSPDQLNDESPVDEIDCINAFKGFPEKMEVGAFVSEIRKLGATDIRVLDEEISHTVFKWNGDRGEESAHHVDLRFCYQNTYFYLRGKYDETSGTSYVILNQIGFPGVSIYPKRNEKREELLTREFYAKPVYESRLMA